MTCVVGLVEDGVVYIGGDSARICGNALGIRPRSKVFRNGDFLIGCAGSIRAEQLMRFALKPPDHDPRIDVDKFMVTSFVDAVRECLKEGGCMGKFETHEEKAGDSAFLIGYKGLLYETDDDLQIVRYEDSFSAVGCGANVALGAMFVSEGRLPEERIRKALSAAERFNTGVRGPFDVQVLKVDG